MLGLLGAGLLLIVAYPELRQPYDLPQLRLFLDTTIMLAASVVAVLAGLRFSVERRGLDLLLCLGFAATAANLLAFAIVPTLDGGDLSRSEAWARVGGSVLALALIAAAPASRGRVRQQPGVVRSALGAVGFPLVALWFGCLLLGGPLPGARGGSPPLARACLDACALRRAA